MRWHVQFRFDGSDHVTWHPSPEAAMEASYLLIHSGVDVFGIGTGPLKAAIDREYVDRLYEFWSKTRYSLRRATGQPHALQQANPAVARGSTNLPAVDRVVTESA
jgi:hypothetical protein